eukprot:4828069-Pleurochrysis_carterae.AAC.2
MYGRISDSDGRELRNKAAPTANFAALEVPRSCACALTEGGEGAAVLLTPNIVPAHSSLPLCSELDLDFLTSNKSFRLVRCVVGVLCMSV